MPDLPELPELADEANAAEDAYNKASREYGQNPTEEQQEVIDAARKKYENSQLDLMKAGFKQPDGPWIKLIKQSGDNMDLTPNERDKVTQGLAKLFSPEPPRVPFGFKTDTEGNLVRDDNQWPYNIKLINKDGNPNIEGLMDSLNDFQEKPDNNIPENFSLKDEEVEALEKYLNEIARTTREATKAPPWDSRTKQAFKNIQDDIRNGKNPNPKDTAIINEFFSSDTYKNWAKNEPDKINKNTADSRAKNGSDTSKPYSKWETFTHLLYFLEFSGALGVILYFLVAYSSAHTGCMKISKKDSNSLEISEKVLCATNKDYPPNTCFCKDVIDYSGGESSSEPCANANDYSATEPRPAERGAPSLCIWDQKKAIQSNYLYYAYQIMTPAGAIPDLLSKGSEALGAGGSKFLEALVHAAIIIGIIIGVLIISVTLVFLTFSLIIN